MSGRCPPPTPFACHSGIVCNLPARTSVLAAANPVGGHYNRAKTVAENLKLATPLLSRFDLIYILLDTADHEKDRLLSSHVMRLHRYKFVPGAAGKALVRGC